MHISWYGTTAFKIQTKPANDEVVVIIDPYKPEEGTFPRNLTADIVLYTRGEKNSITISGTPFIANSAGEWEVKGVLIRAIPGNAPGHTLLRLQTEHVTIGHLGQRNIPLSDEQLEVLSGVDILCIPVGGENTYTAAVARKIVQQIEPRIVIPMNVQSDNDPKSAPVESFIKEIGIRPQEAEKKVIIKKKDLPQEEMHLIVIAKE
ncbi:MBL fold metallo-hydrolase [Patescibacteria group bacterium]|nr:MBL fold metallo-hydrolase [Patescibacteria group bacterium]MBU1721322.1 MBL fold metallo-hydrolase [Patescibacteria group bacterium]MBU1900962.1 MBL fold metallo-hydrolase [Patescibacteria group bacterium]